MPESGLEQAFAAPVDPESDPGPGERSGLSSRIAQELLEDGFGLDASDEEAPSRAVEIDDPRVGKLRAADIVAAEPRDHSVAHGHRGGVRHGRTVHPAAGQQRGQATRGAAAGPADPPPQAGGAPTDEDAKEAPAMSEPAGVADTTSA